MIKVLKKILFIIIAIPIFILAFSMFAAAFGASGGLLIGFTLTVAVCTAVSTATLVLGIINVFTLPDIGLALICASMLTAIVAILFAGLSILIVKKIMPLLVRSCIAVFKTVSKLLTEPSNNDVAAEDTPQYPVQKNGFDERMTGSFGKTAAILAGVALILFGIGALSGTASVIISNSQSSDYVDYNNVVQDNNIQNLKVDIAYGTLEIRSGNEFKISATNVQEGEYSCVINNSTLYIEERSLKKSMHILGWRIPSDALVRTVRNKIPKIVITIPEDTMFNISEICVNSGTIEIDELKSDNLIVQLGAGEVNIDNCVATGKMNAQIAMGAMTFKNIYANNPTIECGTGELSIGGRITGECIINCNAGVTEITLDDMYNRYDIYLRCAAGEIELEDKIHGGIGLKSSYENLQSEDKIVATCGMGCIALR